MKGVEINPELYQWARERGEISLQQLVHRFPKYADWENGITHPTMKQLQDFAKFTHAPFGYLFLKNPPEEPAPIPDFRAVGGASINNFSVNLLDTIYLCQRRQNWYIDYAEAEDHNRLDYVGSANTEFDVSSVARQIRNRLCFNLGKRASLKSWTEALQYFITMSETIGVLVMVSAVVGNDMKRKLDPSEFSGFALVDDKAPLIFINGADTRATQMFTLAYELAHVWLNESGVSNVRANILRVSKAEKWCSLVAAELLVPLSDFRKYYDRNEDIPTALKRLAHRYKVSSLVIVRRIYDAGGLNHMEFQSVYKAELDRHKSIIRIRGDENFCNTGMMRAGKRFCHAIVADTISGETTFKEASRLLGIKKLKTFDKYARQLGFFN